MRRKPESLDMDLFRKAVDDFVKIGGSNLDFNPCIGETLLDPYLMERLKYLKQFPGIKSLGFFTNLQWLHKFNLEEFLDSGITWLMVSVMLLGREKYDDFFGVDRYPQTLENIVNLIKANNQHQNKIKISFSLKTGIDPLKKTADHPDFKMIDALLKGELSKELDKTGLTVHDFCGQIELPQYLRKRPLYPRYLRPCEFFYKVLKVFSNGKIGVCVCADFETTSELTLGDIKKDSLSDIWNGEKLAQLRKRWRKQNIIPSLCRRCSNYAY
jgi:radical SAM protein with 4Fe4S-binding SPASM domain